MTNNVNEILVALIAVRQRNASDFSRSGAVWEAYDQAVLDCLKAVEEVARSNEKHNDVHSPFWKRWIKMRNRVLPYYFAALLVAVAAGLLGLLPLDGIAREKKEILAIIAGVSFFSGLSLFLREADGGGR